MSTKNDNVLRSTLRELIAGDPISGRKLTDIRKYLQRHLEHPKVIELTDKNGLEDTCKKAQEIICTGIFDVASVQKAQASSVPGPKPSEVSKTAKDSKLAGSGEIGAQKTPTPQTAASTSSSAASKTSPNNGNGSTQGKFTT